jgi:hypothetical protein
MIVRLDCFLRSRFFGRDVGASVSKNMRWIRSEEMDNDQVFCIERALNIID